MIEKNQTQQGETLDQIRELLNRYTQPCAEDCEHSQCPLLRELHAIAIRATLERAQQSVKPIVDHERKGEFVGDLMNMQLRTADISQQDVMGIVAATRQSSLWNSNGYDQALTDTLNKLHSTRRAAVAGPRGDALLSDDDTALLAHAITIAREVQEFIWADCYPALRPYDAEGWRRLFQKRVDCIAEIDLTKHGGLAALRKRLLQQAALSIKALALVNRWAKTNPPQVSTGGDGSDLRDAATSPPTPAESVGAMTPEQLERAALIAESRGIDLETAQELVYLRDAAALRPERTRVEGEQEQVVIIDGEQRRVIPCPDGREDCEVLHTEPIITATSNSARRAAEECEQFITCVLDEEEKENIRGMFTRIISKHFAATLADNDAERKEMIRRVEDAVAVARREGQAALSTDTLATVLRLIRGREKIK